MEGKSPDKQLKLDIKDFQNLFRIRVKRKNFKTFQNFIHISLLSL